MRQRSDLEGCLESYACSLLGSVRRLGSGLEGNVPIKAVFQGSLVPGIRYESRARAGTSTVQNIEFDSLTTAPAGLPVGSQTAIERMTRQSLSTLVKCLQPVHYCTRLLLW